MWIRRWNVRRSSVAGAIALAGALCLASGDSYAQANQTAASAAAPAVGTTSPATAPSNQATTRLGDWTWGLGVNLLRFGVLRRPDEAGYRRNYEAEFRWLSPQFTFQVTLQPDFAPWRPRPQFQAMSVSAVVIAGIDTTQARKSELAMGFTFDFLNGIIGVGVAFDLYRGVPVRGGSGESGGDVAPTGLLSAAFLRDGEVTVENVFFLLNLNFVAIGRQVSQ